VLRLHGRALLSVTRVTFHGARGRADDVSVRVRPRRDKRVLVPVPRKAVTGPVSVLARNGRVRSARGVRVRIAGRRPGSPSAAPAPSQAPGALRSPAATLPGAPDAGYAHVRYVSPGGEDSNAGTAGAPWRNVGHALRVAPPDTRILVRAGTYNEDATVSPRGARGAEVSLENFPGERPVLEMQLTLKGATHVRVHGFVFDGAGIGGTAIRVNGGADVEISHNEIRNYRRGETSQAVLLDQDASRTSIVANRIHDTGIWAEHDHGIYCKNAKSAYIANNVLYNLDKGYGVQLYSNDGTGCDGSLITANTIVGNLTSGIVISRGADGNTITGNLITHHGSTESESFGFAVRQGLGIGLGNLVQNNVGFANGQANDFDCLACADVSGNGEADPRFANREAGDFRLLDASLAVDRAHPQHAPAADHEGIQRPQGPAPDVGAHELRAP
jgi:hypothetical protein